MSEHAPQFELNTPAAVSTVSFGPSNSLAVGSDDGSVRIYELPAPKVAKAVRGLGQDVASVCWVQPKSADRAALWVGSGPVAYLFDLASTKLVLQPADAVRRVRLGEDDEDVVNELSVNEARKTLAFGTDAGTVGVVELSSLAVTRMRTAHTNISSSVKFVPDRPSELFSGGFDSALIHFDYKQNTVLSRLDIASAPPTSGVSMSPPFILSTAVSPSGVVAATTADGRLWIGGGGDKNAPSVDKKKRSRKWEGLREQDGTFVQVADGPVVSCAFAPASTALFTSTLLGRLARHDITYDEQKKITAKTSWNAEVKYLAKVNGIAVNEKYLVIGGILKDGKGSVEVWSLPDENASAAEKLAQLSL
ncbi:WD40 repeat-like protein [Phanerochaete sordida]|uniref:WD40 repeat-like protein n=1 Tax=Phanerochaete sordida TaxID=48140 RepID=A0A9P3G9I0_9APHY|nr:WD40 repeat-like protein [Phanerochaete sordida]